jgi:hypothetical protein
MVLLPAMLLLAAQVPLPAQHQGTHGFLLPFDLKVDPMARLVLINFEKDPDTLYIGFEPQVFDDPVNGQGHLVIGWRRDGRVDVYYDPALTPPDPERYDIAGQGLAHLLPTPFDAARFEVTGRGVDLHYRFWDMHGREVLLHIKEDHPARRKPFGLLAPMGDAARAPSAMPLVLLHDFYFVRRRHTRHRISIAGREHRLDRLPLRMDGRKMYFTRYSPDPLILTLNPAADETRQPRMLDRASDRHPTADSLVLILAPSLPDLTCLERVHGPHTVSLCFDPPFPEPGTLLDGDAYRGDFLLRGHPSTGSLSGVCRMERQGDWVLLHLHPSGGWKPRPTKMSLRLMYAMAKVFRQWPATYHWTAELDPLPDGAWHMRSRWTRNP